MADDKLKQQILNEIATGDATAQQCSKKYGISAGTIRSWLSRAKKSNVANNNDNNNNDDVAIKKSATQRKERNATCESKRKNVATDKKKAEKAANRDSSRLINEIVDYKEKLTEKEKLFCFYYVNVHQFNATRSYFEAYGCAYSTARVESSKLLTNPDIREEIARLKQIKYQSILLQAEDLVEKHMRIAFADITDFVEFGRVEVPVMGPFGPVMIKQKVINGKTGQEEERPFPVTKIVNEVRFKESIEVDGSLIKSVKQGRDGASIELLDSQKSMEWLEKYFSWNPMDKHKVAFDKAKLKLEKEKLEKGINPTDNSEVTITVTLVDNDSNEDEVEAS